MTGGVSYKNVTPRRNVPVTTQGVACYGVLRHVGFAAELTWFIFGLGEIRSSVLVYLRQPRDS